MSRRADVPTALTYATFDGWAYCGPIEPPGRAMEGWSHDLPLLPGFYWVRIAGYERAPTIIELDIRDGVPWVAREEPRSAHKDPTWIPLADEYAHEDEVALWGPMVPPE